MPALTGQLGVANAGTIQLGGPPVRLPFPVTTMPKLAVAYIGHVYANDGVTFRGYTGPILNSPTIQSTLNAGFNAVDIEIGTVAIPAPVYGQSVYGNVIYGGTTIPLGSIVKLTEQGGTGAAVYQGVVEKLPDEITGASMTTHKVSLTPMVAELGRAHLTRNYVAVDAAQMVTDAISQTAHLNYNPDSIPPTGLYGTYNFSQATCADVLNQARLISGANYYWSVDANNTVWFKPQPASQTFSFKRGVDYAARKTTGGDITNLFNYIQVTGGVPVGGTQPITALYSDPASIQTYGLRNMQPPLVISSVTDQATLNMITQSMGNIYDRIIQNIEIILPGAGYNIQPGMTVRYWEPATNPFPESETGAGWKGPYLVLDVKRDGPQQTVILGDIPISGSVSDWQYMAERIATMAALSPLTYTPASLNVMGTMSAGGIQTAPAPAPGAQPVPRMSITGNGLVAYDGTSNNYQLPAGAGASVQIDSSGKLWVGGQNANITIDDATGVPRVQIGTLAANGISPAQVGIRVSNAQGAPIMDSLGLIGAAALLGQETLATATAAGSGTGFSTVQTIPGSGVAFTLNRTGNILCLSFCMAGNVAGASNYMAVYQGIWQGATLIARKLVGVGATWTTTPYQFVFGSAAFLNLPAGAYTFRQEFALDASTTSVTFGGFSGAVEAYAEVLQLGG